ncbi:MAG: hypothetical protein M1352_01465 [Patescibacteria group bacterium]|nr:hypothetical protein [Patescibacteria group bacterium]
MEKKLTIRFQKLVGQAAFPPGFFAEGQKFERFEKGLPQSRGSLFCLLTIKGPAEGFEAPVFGKAILDVLEEEYFTPSSEPPLSALEKAADSAHRRLNDLALSSHLGQALELDLVLAVLWGQVLYVCRLGQGGAYLLRDGKVSEIILGEESLVACASGFVYGGDTLILGSPDFKKKFPTESLSLSLGKIEQAMQESGPKSLLAGLVIKLDLEESPGEAESIEFVEPHRPSSRRPKISLPRLRPPSLEVFRARRLGRKSRMAGLFLALLILFSVSVYFTISRQNKIRLANLSQVVYNKADLDLISASDLVNLNNAKAAQILNDTLKSLKNLESLGSKDPKLFDYEQRVKSLLAKVSGETLVQNLKLIYDFNLSENGLRPSNLEGYKNQLILGSQGSGAVFAVPADNPAGAQNVSGGKISSLKEISAYGSRVFVESSGGFYTIDLSSGSVTADDLSGLNPDQIADFGSYNSNLYFLSPSQNQILRSLYGTSGYSPVSSWLKSPAVIKNALNFAIDGDIYVLLSSGQVLKFEGGEAQDFGLSGFSQTLSKQTFIYTTDSLNFLYLVDRENKKIVTFDKNGVFQKTYDLSGSGLPSLDSLYVNSDNSNLYVLSGTKIYVLAP